MQIIMWQLIKSNYVIQFTCLAAYDQANLAGSENVDHIAAQFGASGGKSTEFGGQDLLDQQNQQQNANGGQLTSTQSRTKRTAA